MRTFNELCGLSWNKNAMIARCGGGGNDSSSNSSNDDSSSSSSSSSTMTNQDRINEIYANSNDPWGTDGAELNKLVADRDGTYNGGSSSNNSSSSGYTSFFDMFDGGGPGASGDSYSNTDNTAMDTNNDGHISFAETSAGQDGNNNLPGGIDGSDNIDTTNSVTSALSSGSNDVAIGGNDSSSTSTNTNTNTNTNTSTDTSTSGGSDTSTSTTTTSTDTTNNDLITDLENQIADLQNQLANMNTGGRGGTTIVYEGSGGTETALPDDYLTEADLARYFDNLDLGSSAYDPAAFLNAYGFALDPAAFGGIIPTFSNTNGVYMRRAVKDKDTGEIRYVNVPIGAGATMGNDGLSMFRNERRTGFGSFL